VVKVKVQTTGGRGRRWKTVKGFTPGEMAEGEGRGTAPLLEVILRSQYARRGMEQPTKQEMTGRLIREIARRVRSVAFLAAGFLPAMREFFAATHGREGNPGVAGVKSYGVAKGRGVPAVGGWSPRR